MVSGLLFETHVDLFWLFVGQAEHNLAYLKTKDLRIYLSETYADPPLTEEGIRQAQSLTEQLSNKNLDRVLVSPLKRTIQTALLAFPREKGFKYTCLEWIR